MVREKTETPRSQELGLPPFRELSGSQLSQEHNPALSSLVGAAFGGGRGSAESAPAPRSLLPPAHPRSTAAGSPRCPLPSAPQVPAHGSRLRPPEGPVQPPLWGPDGGEDSGPWLPVALALLGPTGLPRTPFLGTPPESRPVLAAPAHPRDPGDPRAAGPAQPRGSPALLRCPGPLPPYPESSPGGGL